MPHEMPDKIWDSPTAILSKFDVDADGLLNYKEFRMLCVELFGTNEVNDNQWRVREIFQLFDTNMNNALSEHDLHRCFEWIRETVNPVNVLLIVDMQNDFIDGALSLRKSGGDDGGKVIEPINQLLRNGHWGKVIYSQDWHPEDHISFFDNLTMRELHPESKITHETAKPFDTVIFLQPYLKQRLWPKHCVMKTWGAELHKDLLILDNSERVYKAQNSEKEMYSVFSDNNTDGALKIVDILSKNRATHIYICGIAYDICVKMTCLEGLQLGYRLAVIDDCCGGIDSDEIATTKRLISENGGLVTNSDSALSYVNKGKRSIVMAHHAAKNIK